MSALKLSMALATCAAACPLLLAAPGNGYHDVLDTPAMKSPLAERGLLNGLARAGQRVVAVGQRGHVLWSDDGGRRWRQAEVPVSSDLVAVSFPDATNGWAVGHDGVVLKTSDGGQRWTRQLDGRQLGVLMVEYYAAHATTDPKLQDEARRIARQDAETPFLDVWFADASNGFVVGAFGLIFRTTDGGAHWEPWLHAVDNPKRLHLYAVRGIGADVYIVGEQGLALKLDRKAGRFRALALPYHGTLFGIAGNARAIVVHGLRGNLLRSTDGGQHWQPVDTGLRVGLTGSTVADDGRFVIVSQAGHLLTSRDDGASFARAPIEQPVPAAAVVATANGALVVAGPRGARPQPLP